MKRLATLALVTPLFLTSVAFAQDVVFETEDKSVTLSGGVGILAIESREYVYRNAGSSDLLSLLIWQSTAPLLSTSLDVQLPDNWSISASVDMALSGDSYMEDYDWIVPGLPGSPDMTNWSHQSKHPDTALDWYFNGSLLAAYKIALENGTDVKVFGGFEYTDVQWTASGGSYIYSSDPGFRDLTGNFGPGKAITYRQQFPSIVTGATATVKSGNWTFDVGAKGGVTFGSKATDDHWLRDLRFVEDVYLAPVLGATASATYAVSDQLDFFVSGKVDRIFLGRSDTEIFDIPTSASLATFPDASGADLLSGVLKVGLKGSF